MLDLTIGGKTVGEKHPVYIIAEIGLNHQGDIKLAKKLIDAAGQAGSDCVKFQKRSLKDLYKKEILEKPGDQEQGLQYILSHVSKCELSEKDMAELAAYSSENGLDFICTPWDEPSLRFLNKLNIPAYKIGSPDMSNLLLIKHIIQLKKPVIISTGMSFLSEIEQLINFLNDNNAKYILLHCNSTYPAPYDDLNLNFIKTLQEKSRYAVGYSGHEPGIFISVAAVALGAKVIEKHITLDKNLPGPDHKASLEPEEFTEMVQEIRRTERALGSEVRYPSRGEFLNRENLSKSLVVSRNIKKGGILDFADIEVRSPGHGTSPLKMKSFIGQKLTNRDLKKGDYLLESDIGGYIPMSDLHGVRLKHKWGVVARMSDIDEQLTRNPDFVEIHLTSADVNADKIYKKKYDIDIAIHAPEYNGNQLMDLSSLDENIRRKSIEFLNEALAHSRKLKKLFRNRTAPVKFVIHPGGMDMKKPLLDQRAQMVNNLAESLKRLNSEDFEVLVENMPPCPWYFGGQWYHGAFMDAKELVQFSQKTGYGLIFDTSHAALYCNYYKKDIEEYVKKILPYTKYLHVSDAAGFNGEGLKIGDGTIDFRMMLKYLVKTKLWFLPEIWQGHKFGGEDFVVAIRNLKLINREL